MNTNRQRAIDFLRCAEIDLASSRCLYFCEHYSASIYHLQQAVEKTLKSILFWLHKDAHVSHKTMTACIKILDIEKFLPLISDPNLQKIIKDIIRIDECESALEACARRSLLEIKNNISFLVDLKHEIEKIIQSSDHQQLSEEDKLECMTFLRWGLIISILAYYLAPHEALTRYPDNKITPMDYYPGNLGIVDVAPDFCDILQTMIVSLHTEYGASPTILQK
ncbi:hypothetical protein DSECCO2_547810 [anaerobic digester metagenome]|jgi:HEPN domain-containing protein